MNISHARCIPAQHLLIGMVIAPWIIFQAADAANLLQPLPNDACTDAIPVVANITIDGTTIGATGTESSSCAVYPPTTDVWYVFTPDQDGVATVHLAALIPSPYYWSSYPSIAVYDACGGNALACNSQFTYGMTEATLDIRWAASQNTPYFIQVEESQGGGYDFTLRVALQPPLPNDRCEDAIPLEMDVPVQGCTDGATGTDLSSCGSDDFGDVWYVFTPVNDGTVFLNLCENTTATYGTLTVFDTCGGNELLCMGTDDNYAALSVIHDVSYRIRVAGCLGRSIEFALRVFEAEPPANDDCAQAIPLAEDTPVWGDTFGATGTDISSCAFWDGKDVWYTFTPTRGGTAEIALADVDACVFGALTVFDSCDGAELACGYDSIRMPVQPAQKYLIRASGHNNLGYHFSLRATVPLPPPNDTCDHALPVTENTLILGTTVGAGGDDLEVPHDQDWIDVWYVFTPSQSGTADISLCDVDFGLNTALTVFDQCQGTPLAQSDNAFGMLSLARVSVEHDTAYLIRVAAHSGTWGDFSLRITMQAAGTCPPDTGDVALLNGSWQWGWSDGFSGASTIWTFDNSACANTYSVERQSWSITGDSFSSASGTYTLDENAGRIILAVSQVCSEFYCDTYPEPDISVQSYALDGTCLVLGVEALSPPGIPCALGEGATDGEPQEGAGEGTGETSPHQADQNGDGRISLSELLRVIQLFNTGGYHCAPGTEDGFATGPGDTGCPPHNSDYNPQDWAINLSELLRMIQFFNLSAYHACPDQNTEDGYCPGME